MTMTVKKRRDGKTPSVFIHKTADIRGGVSVAASELGGNYLREGAVLSEPADGITHVVKTAQIAADAAETATTLKVGKFHNLKPGDAVMTEPGKTAVKVTAIEEGKDTDTLTLSAALGELKAGAFIAEAKAEGEKAELKYEPQSVSGSGKSFDPKTNINTDAWVIGVTRRNPVPPFISEKLKGIINL